MAGFWQRSLHHDQRTTRQSRRRHRPWSHQRRKSRQEGNPLHRRLQQCRSTSQNALPTVLILPTRTTASDTVLTMQSFLALAWQMLHRCIAARYKGDSFSRQQRPSPLQRVHAETAAHFTQPHQRKALNFKQADSMSSALCAIHPTLIQARTRLTGLHGRRRSCEQSVCVQPWIESKTAARWEHTVIQTV